MKSRGKLYVFDEKELRYKEYRKGWEYYGRLAAVILGVSLVVGVCFAAVFVHFFESSSERILREENARIKARARDLEEKIKTLSAAVDEVWKKNAMINAILLGDTNVSEIEVGYGGYEPVRHEAFITEPGKMIAQVEEKSRILAKKVFFVRKKMEELLVRARERASYLRHTPAIFPLELKEEHRIISGFGIRIDPVYGVPRQHTGIDIVCQPGTPVYATGDGIVEFAGSDNSGYGIHVIINHGNGYRSLYGHLSGVTVRDGDRVRRGDVVGYCGSTGKSVGPHLHYEVIKNEEKVNPMEYFFMDIKPGEYSKIVKEANSSTHSLD